MNDCNDIGISRQLDWPRIRKLLTIGLAAALLHWTGDLILGWGVEDESLTGVFRMLSAYTSTADGGLFAAALLGLMGMTLAGLCYFGVYRLMAERSPSYAHRYRAGIFGSVIFGGCGFHVPVCALVFLQKHGVAEELLKPYLTAFLLPGFALFWVFFLVLVVTHIQAFGKGLTPYPKWCWVFSPPVGMLLAMLPGVAGNVPFANAMACGWIAFGNVWMFGGLLATMGLARERKADVR